MTKASIYRRSALALDTPAHLAVAWRTGRIERGDQLGDRFERAVAFPIAAKEGRALGGGHVVLSCFVFSGVLATENGAQNESKRSTQETRSMRVRGALPGGAGTMYRGGTYGAAVLLVLQY